jgi:ERCC4-type nuclease
MERHPLLTTLGENSAECEKLGADFLFPSINGLVGVQRKAVSDLVSSLRDRRLPREIVQMEELDHAILIIEGDWQWNYEGISGRTGFSIQEYRGLVFGLQFEHDIRVLTTANVEETAEVLVHLERWFNKTEHGSLLRVPKAKVDPRLHLLQYFDGISLTRAKAIFDWFGRVPLRWDVTKEEMTAVPSLGKVTVEKMWKVLE